MRDNRYQEYLDLVQKLLICPSGQEQTILSENPDLLDTKLAQTIRQFEPYLGRQVEPEKAQFLLKLVKTIENFAKESNHKSVKGDGITAKLASILRKIQQLTSIRESPQKIQLCQQALSLISREQNPPLWAALKVELGNSLTQNYLNKNNRAQDIEKAIIVYQQALEVITKNTMPVDWATVSTNMGNAYSERIRGNRAENLEQAIFYYKQALEVIKRTTMPINWAKTLNNLATVYQNRLKGNRAANLEQAISYYKQTLELRTKYDSPLDWANTMNNLGNVYTKSIRGNRADNLEQAISYYEQALEVINRAAMPIYWAQIISNLAVAYGERIRGNRADNLEQAISYYEQALELRTKYDSPLDWATTMNNLAASYSERIKGNKAENLEQAIFCYKEALQALTFKDFPVDWAMIQKNLGTAYFNRIKGNKAENLEKTITFYRQALEILTHQDFPVDWARTQNNLGNAYLNRIEGDKGDNLEQAIIFYRQALEIRTRQHFPVDWAMTQNNLGNAYLNRIKGDKGDNLEKAITFYRQALEIRTRQHFPIDWATTMSNLALAYSERISGDRADNLEQAIFCYKKTLEVSTYQDFPIDWARTQNNLGNAYLNRIKGDKGDNLEQAITFYRQALEILTRQHLPIDWARTQNNLGNTYLNRIEGDKGDNLEQAIYYYKKALEIFLPETLPFDCRRTARLLGDLYAQENRWTEAAHAYQLALEASEIPYEASLSLAGKEDELAKTGELFHRTAYALACSGDLESAVVMIERGRARSLSENLARDKADLEQVKILAPEVYKNYQQATNLLHNLKEKERIRNTLEIENKISIIPEEILQQSLEAKQMLKKTVDQIRQIQGYESFLTLPTFEEIVKALNQNQPLIYLTTNPKGSLALIVYLSNSSPYVESIRLDLLPDFKLREMLMIWVRAYNNHLDNQQTWLDTIDIVTNELWVTLMEPIISNLKNKAIQQAILIPTGLLGLLPLHAAWTEDLAQPSNRLYALDEICFSYTPNARSLIAAREIAIRTQPDALLAVDEPLPVKAEKLLNTGKEIQAAIKTFPKHQIFKHENATQKEVKKALSNYSVLHFSCHGYANFRDPLNSGLLMTNDEILSLQDLFDLRLTNTRLAVLSACETALSSTRLIDEVISLPTGMLQAGVAGVAASLWSISDLSTMMLMAKFYELWRNKEHEPPEALRKAQQWVRDTTNREKVAYFENYLTEFSTDEKSTDTAYNLYKLAIQKNLNTRDFAHPFYWAAFTYTGS